MLYYILYTIYYILYTIYYILYYILYYITYYIIYYIIYYSIYYTIYYTIYYILYLYYTILYYILQDPELTVVLEGEGMPEAEAAGSPCGPLELRIAFPRACGSASGPEAAGRSVDSPALQASLGRRAERRARARRCASAVLATEGVGPDDLAALPASPRPLEARTFTNRRQLRELRYRPGASSAAARGPAVHSPVFALLLGAGRLPRGECERLSEELLPLVASTAWRFLLVITI